MPPPVHHRILPPHHPNAMHHLTRAVLGYFLNAEQENQHKDIDSEGVIVRKQETPMSREASSTSSSFYLVSGGTLTQTSSMPPKNQPTPELGLSSLSRQLDQMQLDELQRSGDLYSDNLRRKSLERELERLRISEGKIRRRINRRKQELETLRLQDEEERWEDDLFETRLKELEAANAIIDTRSSVSNEGIIIRVKKMNELIIHISSVLVLTKTSRPHIRLLYDAITEALGHDFLSFFQKYGYYFEEQTVKALLQIYLARSCTGVICSWYPEKDLNRCLDQLYNIIVVNESQAIAGKWRQMAFKQLPHERYLEALQHHMIDITRIILKIASSAGWGGDVSEIQALVHELVMDAKTMREYTKTGIISTDIQAWVALSGDIYDPVTMEGNLNESRMGNRVLGSTGIGLRVGYASRDDGVASQTLLPSKVFCIRG